MAADSPLRAGLALGVAARVAWICAGLALASLAIALPDDLAPPTPQAPIDGTPLARLALSVTALAAIAVGALGRRLPRAGDSCRLVLPSVEGSGAVRRPLAWLTVITALAAALRLYGLDGDLWIDEIANVETASRPFREFFTTPKSLNHHLLHTVLVRGMLELTGAREWAVRLPAVVFGVATVPAIYALARQALRPRESLLVALLVATSYHHVLYSQNSRGYTSLIFWTVLATWFFARALSADRTRDWIGFAGTSFLAGASVLVAGFTLLGQAAVLGLVAHQIRRAGGDPRPITVKALVVIAAICLVLLDMYAAALPRFYRQVAPKPDMWMESAGPTGFWYELGRGLGEGFGETGLVAVVVLIVAVSPGVFLFVRRHSVYCALLCAPLATLGAAVLLIGLFAMPRYFLWALVPFALGFVGSASVWPPRTARWTAPALAALVAVGSLMALRSYYAVPFQASRESLEWVLQESSPQDVVVVIGATGRLARYYGPRVGLLGERTVFEVDSLDQLLAIEARYADRNVWLLSTQWLLILVRTRSMSEHIDRCYRPLRTYPAKVHRMEITVWTRRCEVAPLDGA
jgi:mannosyltransferase